MNENSLPFTVCSASWTSYNAKQTNERTNIFVVVFQFGNEIATGSASFRMKERWRLDFDQVFGNDGAKLFKTLYIKERRPTEILSWNHAKKSWNKIATNHSVLNYNGIYRIVFDGRGWLSVLLCVWHFMLI